MWCVGSTPHSRCINCMGERAYWGRVQVQMIVYAANGRTYDVVDTSSGPLSTHIGLAYISWGPTPADGGEGSGAQGSHLTGSVYKLNNTGWTSSSHQLVRPTLVHCSFTGQVCVCSATRIADAIRPSRIIGIAIFHFSFEPSSPSTTAQAQAHMASVSHTAQRQLSES